MSQTAQRLERRRPEHSHRDSLLRLLWIGSVLLLQTIEWDERDTAELLLDHDIEDLGSNVIVLDDDVEQTARSA